MRLLKAFGFGWLALSVAQPASAQVIINFNNSSVSGVPFSPWIVVFMAAMVALTGLFFIRKKAGFGVFFMLITAGVLVSTVVDNPNSFALPFSQYALTTSGQDIADVNEVAYMSPAPVCGPVGFVWVTSGVGNITLTGINYAPGYAMLDPTNPPSQTQPLPLPTAPAPLCTVGTMLNASTSCVVWYQKPGPC
jgi:hypothetical protein